MLKLYLFIFFSIILKNIHNINDRRFLHRIGIGFKAFVDSDLKKQTHQNHFNPKYYVEQFYQITTTVNTEIKKKKGKTFLLLVEDGEKVKAIKAIIYIFKDVSS